MTIMVQLGLKSWSHALKMGLHADDISNFINYCLVHNQSELLDKVYDYADYSTSLSPIWLDMLRPVSWICTGEQLLELKIEFGISANTPIFFLPPNLDYRHIDKLNGDYRFTYYNCKESWPYIIRERTGFSYESTDKWFPHILEDIPTVVREDIPSFSDDDIVLHLVRDVTPEVKRFIELLHVNKYIKLKIEPEHPMEFRVWYYNDAVREFCEPYINSSQSYTGLSNIHDLHHRTANGVTIPTVIMGMSTLAQTKSGCLMTIEWDMAWKYNKTTEDVGVYLSFQYYSTHLYPEDHFLHYKVNNEIIAKSGKEEILL